MIIIAFVIIDFGRLIQARLIVANVAREGGSLASRDIQSAGNLITMLQAGASLLDLSSNGRIYIWKIRAGKTKDSAGQFHPDPDPYIDLNVSACVSGGLSVVSSVSGGQCGGNSNGAPNLGTAIYNHLVFTIDRQPDGRYQRGYRSRGLLQVHAGHPDLQFVPTLFSGRQCKIIASKAVF